MNKIESDDFGGKANSLYKLQKLGFNVPKFIVFKQADLKSITQPDFEQKVHLAFENQAYFAIRSSANLEDGNELSFAGLFNTALFISKIDLWSVSQNLFDNFRTEKLISYCEINDVNLQTIQLNIIIQEMIPATVSGVAFGRNPTKPYLNEPLISSTFGLGEALVSGEVDGDTFTFNQFSWQKNIVAKEKQLVFKEEKLVYEHVPLEQQLKESLNENQLSEIKETLESLEKELGKPQDIEFCYLDNRLYLLQSRPITTLAYDQLCIWDNSNIIESYPEITLPFTFSFILDIYESVYKNLGLILGVPRKLIADNEAVFKNMLGHINGRVYYHLINWYKALAMLPMYKINASFMEKMMGVSESINVPIVIHNPLSKFKGYFYTLKSIFKIVKQNRNLPKTKDKFTQKVNDLIKSNRAIDLSQKTDLEIWALFQNFKKILVEDWSPPLINDLLAMIYFGSLQKLCTNWLSNSHLHTLLIVGRNKVKSMDPAFLVDKIVTSINDEKLISYFEIANAEAIWSKISNNELGETGELIKEYIEKYGDRVVSELKIENETYAQNPLPFIQLIKTYSSSKPSNHASSPPIDAEKYTQNLPWYRKIIFNYVLKKAAETVSDRENLRFDRTRAFGTVRHFMFALARIWETEGIISKKSDLFYLKEQEIEEYIYRKISAIKLQNIISERKKEFQEFSEISEMPERIYQWKGQLDFSKNAVEILRENTLTGIPCCVGEVIARVRVMKKADEISNLNQEILVTSSTDPGWITIFKSASGILVERGSTLSHAAIVSRELNIPCIVGVKGLLQSLKTGDLVKMNGMTGEILKIDEE